MTDHALEAPRDRRRPRNPFAAFVASIRNRPLVWFFVLTYAFSWWPALTYATTGSGPTILSCGPFLAAVTVLSLTRGKAGVKALFGSMVKWRVPARWWAIAILGPIVLSALATALNVALGAPMPTSAELGTWTNILPTALLILTVPLIALALVQAFVLGILPWLYALFISIAAIVVALVIAAALGRTSV